MSTVEMRTEVHQMIDEIDSTLLEAIYAMLDAYQKRQEDPIIGYSVGGSPMYASVAKEEFKRRVEAVDDGAFITLEELKNEAQTWLKNK